MNKQDHIISPSIPVECSQIATIIKSGFNADKLKLFIYGYDGIEFFVKNQIEIQDCGGDTKYFSCRFKKSDKEIIACAVIRKISELSYNLNYISVKTEHQGQGIGRRILEHLISSLYSCKCESITLDVYIDNDKAINFYKSFGFKVIDKDPTSWVKLNLHRKKKKIEVIPLILNYPEAEASHIRFGFSNYRIQSHTKTYSIGRLGNKFIRLTESGLLLDTTVTEFLLQFHKNRSFLLISNDQIHRKLINKKYASSIKLTLNLKEYHDNK